MYVGPYVARQNVYSASSDCPIQIVAVGNLARFSLELY